MWRLSYLASVARRDGTEVPGGDVAAASFVPSAAADAWQRALAFLDGQPSG